MTEQELEELIQEAVWIRRGYNGADRSLDGRYDAYTERFFALSQMEQDHINAEADRRVEAMDGAELDEAVRNYQPPTLHSYGAPWTAEDVNAAGFGIPAPSQTVLTVDWEEIARLQRQQLLLPRVPEPEILPFRLTSETERMLARLINPATLGERLCRAFLMGDEVALQALMDGIKGGEIEVQP